MEREVNRLLAQLAQLGTPAVRDHEPRPARVSGPVTPHRSAAIAPTSPKPSPPSRRDLVALWARVLLGIALGALMAQWPYPRGCGWPLLGYLCAVGIVLLTAAWIALASWKLRSASAHILSLILFFWGTVLAAEQLLPRIGYAADEASWRCTLSQETAAAPSTPR
jgi:hypothetical protein